MDASTPVLDIEDLDGPELSDDELAEISGGARQIVIVITVPEPCTCAVGGGVDYD
jgi:lactobin A/cerein 7B family class IIb bacteriocin